MMPVMRPWIGEEEVEATAAAIRSGWIAQGPRVAEFEERLAEFVGNEHGVAVSSCTTGLHLVLHALGIGPGDEVVVPSLSFIASSNAPRYVGATPVFADVDATTANLTADSISAVLTERTAAVIAVHQVGMPVQLDEIRRLCRRRGLQLIEDAACAAGSFFGDDRIGTGPDPVVFSFHPRKLLTTGEGGMVVTADADLAARLRALRQHAMSVSAFDRHSQDATAFEEYTELGFNFRMTDIQAAVGLVQLRKLAEMVEHRRALAAAYQSGLAGLPGLTTPHDPEYGRTNYQSYTVLVGPEFPISRNALIAGLHSRGISTRRGVMAAHREPAFAETIHTPLPTTELLADGVIILPMFHDMTGDDVATVVDAIGEVSSNG